MEMLGRKDRLMGTKEFSLKDNQEDLLARLEAERDNLPEGPVVSILMAGAELAGRARAMHAELSRRLREWFPDA
jgi:hypothetical protein